MIYEGGIKNGKYHGKGKMLQGERLIYDGGFVEGIKSGYGKLCTPDYTY